MPLGDVYTITPCGYMTAKRQLSENQTHWIVQTLVGGGVSAQAIANFFDSAFSPLFTSLMGTDSDYIGTRVQKIWPLPLQVAAISFAAAAPGGPGTGVTLPTQVAGLMSLRTAEAGRHGRGRMYLPFPGVTLNLDGSPTAAYSIAAASLSAMLMTPQVVSAGAASTTLVCGVFDRVSKVLTPIVSAVASLEWATQRRRGAYGASNPRPF